MLSKLVRRQRRNVHLQLRRGKFAETLVRDLFIIRVFDNVFKELYMVYVAERFRRKFVALVYAGSNPVVHPNILKETLILINERSYRRHPPMCRDVRDSEM